MVDFLRAETVVVQRTIIDTATATIPAGWERAEVTDYIVHWRRIESLGASDGRLSAAAGPIQIVGSKAADHTVNHWRTRRVRPGQLTFARPRLAGLRRIDRRNRTAGGWRCRRVAHRRDFRRIRRRRTDRRRGRRRGSCHRPAVKRTAMARTFGRVGVLAGQHTSISGIDGSGHDVGDAARDRPRRDRGGQTAVCPLVSWFRAHSSVGQSASLTRLFGRN